jgi:predicted ATPase
MIITGANAMVTEAPQFDGRDNPVFNFFTEVYLQLLESSECSVMMRELGRGMGITFLQDATDYVYALTGGHPFFARQLCSFVAEHFTDRPLNVNRSMIERLIDRYLDVRSGDFEEIIERLTRDFPDELAICIDLAAAGGRLPLETIRHLSKSSVGSAIRHLTGYQIVATDRQTAYLTIDLFRRWLHKRYVS